MKMKITGDSARNLNKAALNSGRATRRPMNSSNAETTRRQLNSNHKETERRQLNSNHKATRRPTVNAASRRPLAPVATERPMLNSSARRPVLNSSVRRPLDSVRIGKTVEVPIIQGNYGYGWEDVSEYEKGQDALAKADIKEYRASRDGGSYRLIYRRVPNPAYKAPETAVEEEVKVDSSRRPARPLANDDKNYKLNSARRRPLKKLNSNRSAILKELEGWFDKDEAVEYLDSFEKQTGATATKLATDEEVDKYDGVFWATKDGKESLWCLHDGTWVEEDLDSAKKLNSAEGEATEETETTSETAAESTAETAEETTSEEETAEEEIEVTDLLIVQDPESKELSLFIPDTPEEAVPEDVEVIATVEAATAEDLDSSCGGKKKLNSSEEDSAEAATEDEAKEDEAKESESTEAEEEAVVELPDGETVEVEDIFVVQTDDGEYDLFIAEEDAELPEEVEVVGEAVAVDEDEILNSSRQLKKLNSSKDTDKKATK